MQIINDYSLEIINDDEIPMYYDLMIMAYTVKDDDEPPPLKVCFNNNNNVIEYFWAAPSTDFYIDNYVIKADSNKYNQYLTYRYPGF
jgi:hypothetical protein